MRSKFTVISIFCLLFFAPLLLFQNCGKTFSTTSSSYIDSLEDPLTETPPKIESVISCPIANGLGQITIVNGIASDCLVLTCNSGFKNVSNSCVVSSQNCPIPNGNGLLQSDSSCKIDTCNPGFVASGNQCVATTPPAQPFPETMSFFFRRGSPTSIDLVPGSPFPSNITATLLVKSINSSEPWKVKAFFSDALNIGNKLNLSIKRDDTLARLTLTTNPQIALTEKSIIQLEVTSDSALLPKLIRLVIEPKDNDVVQVVPGANLGDGRPIGITYSRHPLKSNPLTTSTTTGTTSARWQTPEEVLPTMIFSKMPKYISAVANYPMGGGVPGAWVSGQEDGKNYLWYFDGTEVFRSNELGNGPIIQASNRWSYSFTGLSSDRMGFYYSHFVKSLPLTTLYVPSPVGLLEKVIVVSSKKIFLLSTTKKLYEYTSQIPNSFAGGDLTSASPALTLIREITAPEAILDISHSYDSMMYLSADKKVRFANSTAIIDFSLRIANPVSLDYMRPHMHLQFNDGSIEFLGMDISSPPAGTTFIPNATSVCQTPLDYIVLTYCGRSLQLDSLAGFDKGLLYGVNIRAYKPSTEEFVPRVFNAFQP